MRHMLSDAKYFDDSSTKFAEVRALLDSKEHKDKLEAMKRLLAMMTMGKDVSIFFPDVVKNVVVENIEIKKLVYMFLVHYSETNQDLALLSINTFQRDLTSPNERIRANAISAMCGIKVNAVVPLIILALKQTVMDPSSYVRRAAAQAIPNVYMLDKKNQYEQCCDMIAELLSSVDPSVIPAALFAFNTVCPTNYTLLHPYFRKICHLLADFDSFGQALALKILTQYARHFLPSPQGFFPLEHTPPPSTLLAQGIVPILTSNGATANNNNNNTQNGISIDDLTTTAAKLLDTTKNGGYAQDGTSGVSNVLAKFRQTSNSPFYDDGDDNGNNNEETTGKTKKGKKTATKKTKSTPTPTKNTAANNDDLLNDEFFNDIAPTPTKPQINNTQVTPTTNKNNDNNNNTQTQQQQIDQDLALLLKTASTLLHTSSTSVIVEIAALYQAFAPKTLYPQLISALVRLSRNTRSQSFVLLTTIATFANRTPQYLQQYIQDFFVVQTDPIYIRGLKLDILNALLLSAHDAQILHPEMVSLCRSPDKDVVCKAINILGRICLLVPTFCGVTLRVLYALLELNNNDCVTLYSANMIRVLLQRHAQNIPTIILKKLIVLLSTKLEEPLSRAIIIYLLAQHCCTTTPRTAAVGSDGTTPAQTEGNPLYLHTIEMLRQLSINFVEEHNAVKSQILNLAIRCYLYSLNNPTNTIVVQHYNTIALLFKYIMDLCKYDVDVDIREKARFYRTIFFRKKAPANTTLQDGEIDHEQLLTILPQAAKDQLKVILASIRPPCEPQGSLTTVRDHYRFGTMSHMLSRKTKGYAPLPHAPVQALCVEERENVVVQQQQPQLANMLSPISVNKSGQLSAQQQQTSVQQQQRPGSAAQGKKTAGMMVNTKKHFDSFYDDDDDEEEEEEEEEEDEDYEDEDYEDEDYEEEDEDYEEEEEEEETVQNVKSKQPAAQNPFDLLNGTASTTNNNNNNNNNANNGGFFDF